MNSKARYSHWETTYLLSTPRWSSRLNIESQEEKGGNHNFSYRPNGCLNAQRGSFQVQCRHLPDSAIKYTHF